MGGKPTFRGVPRSVSEPSNSDGLHFVGPIVASTTFCGLSDVILFHFETVIQL